MLGHIGQEWAHRRDMLGHTEQAHRWDVLEYTGQRHTMQKWKYIWGRHGHTDRAGMGTQAHRRGRHVHVRVRLPHLQMYAPGGRLKKYPPCSMYSLPFLQNTEPTPLWLMS